MGVFSFARYDDNFYKRSSAGRLKKHLQPRQKDYSVFDGYYTPPITSSLLLRSCKVTKKHLSLLNVFSYCWFASGHDLPTCINMSYQSTYFHRPL